MVLDPNCSQCACIPNFRQSNVLENYISLECAPTNAMVTFKDELRNSNFFQSVSKNFFLVGKNSTTYDNDCAVSDEILDENELNSTSTPVSNTAGSDFDKCGFEIKKSNKNWQHSGELVLIENGIITASVDIICEANQIVAKNSSIEMDQN